VLTAAVVYWQSSQSHLEYGTYGGMQGRYLFGALVPVFAAMAIGLGVVTREDGRPQQWLPTLAVPVVVASVIYGLLVTLSGYYIDLGWTVSNAFRQMTDWSPWSDLGVRALIGCFILQSLVLFGLALRRGIRPGRDGGSPDDDTMPGTSFRPPVSVVGAGATRA
jgi:hypothetical protein